MTNENYMQWVRQDFSGTRPFTRDELEHMNVSDRLTAADINQMTLQKYQKLDLMGLTELKRKAPAVYEKYRDMDLEESMKRTANR